MNLYKEYWLTTELKQGYIKISFNFPTNNLWFIRVRCVDIVASGQQAVGRQSRCMCYWPSTCRWCCQVARQSVGPSITPCPHNPPITFSTRPDKSIQHMRVRRRKAKLSVVDIHRHPDFSAARPRDRPPPNPAPCLFWPDLADLFTIYVDGTLTT